MNNSDNIDEFKRWQSLYLASLDKYNSKKIAEIVNVSPHSVTQWVYYYNKDGESGICSKPRGVRRTSYLSWEEELELLEELSNHAEKGLLVIVKDIKPVVEKRLSRQVSKDYVYDLIHRHGWK